MANKYRCSDGSYVTEPQIRSRYSQALKQKHAGKTVWICGGCGRRAVHNDHTIAKARCKVIGKTELIWEIKNFEDSCGVCHHQWEGFKSGEWINHHNVEKRLIFLKQNDPEGYTVRIELTETN